MEKELISHSHAVSRMRGMQSIAKGHIITDVLEGREPTSVQSAIKRYTGLLGDEYHFETKAGWSGELREQAIVCLIHHGFKKAGVVSVGPDDDELFDWSKDAQALDQAADLEIAHGGNHRVAEIAKRSAADFVTLGKGLQAVYVYSDSRLDKTSDICVKVGRHNSSSGGAVLWRIVSQYGTGNPGHPVLRCLIKTDDAVKLEAQLHDALKDHAILDGFGTEWFSVGWERVIEEYAKCSRVWTH